MGRARSRNAKLVLHERYIAIYPGQLAYLLYLVRYSCVFKMHTK
jgi:hypothetical protein